MDGSMSRVSLLNQYPVLFSSHLGQLFQYSKLDQDTHPGKAAVHLERDDKIQREQGTNYKEEFAVNFTSTATSHTWSAVAKSAETE